MKKLKGFLTGMLVICLFMISSCDKEPSNNSNSIKVSDSCIVDGQINTGIDTITIEPCVDFTFDTIDLKPCSFKSIPYKIDTNLVFTDNLNNEVVFNLVSQRKGPYYGTWYNTFYCNWHDTTSYIVQGLIQNLEFILMTKNNEFDFDFWIELSSFVSVKSNKIIFKEEIDVIKFDSNGQGVAYTEVCLYPEDPLNVYRSDFYLEKLLNDKLFQYVYASQKNDLFYNFKYGLIGFRDDKQNLWVLKTE